MCTALENLKQEGWLESRREMIWKVVELLRELNIDETTIFQKLQDKFHITIEEIQRIGN